MTSSTSGSASDPRVALAEGATALRRALSRSVGRDPGLAAVVDTLSAGYRTAGAAVDPAGHVRDGRTAAAYAAARMPATFAAAGRAMTETAASLPDLVPRRLLDVGSGSGAAAWAAVRVWPSLRDLVLIDREPATIDLGRRLAAAAGTTPLATAEWRSEALGTSTLGEADLVTAVYLLGEVPDAERRRLVGRLWDAARGALVLVEPGSPAGYGRLMAARTELIAAGGHVAAPCPGDLPCPLVGPDWCHFLVRLERSRLHRQAKSATRSWEDEPFSYVALSRTPVDPAARAVLGRPRTLPGRVEIRVCATDGRIHRAVVSRREGPRYRAARAVAWGDRIPDVVAAGLADRDGPTDAGDRRVSPPVVHSDDAVT